MSRLRQTIFFLAFAALVFSAHADVPAVPSKKFPFATNVPPLPQSISPVSYFRELLAMSPVERLDSLTNRPPEIRQRILDKVNEYLALDPDERELRLRATELRWFLLPLLRTSPTNYAARLEQVPEELRPLVKSRLEQWQILPPPLQQEFLENDRALHYFTHVEPTNATSGNVSAEQHQKMAAQFNQFFELTPAEKSAALNTLSAAERAQMEKTLQSFDKLPPPQRSQCVRNFARFAGMSPQERAEFLKNAEKWAQMSPKERRAWTDLVAHVPQWPPLPTALIMPPLPPGLKNLRPPVATNL